MDNEESLSVFSKPTGPRLGVRQGEGVGGPEIRLWHLHDLQKGLQSPFANIPPLFSTLNLATESAVLRSHDPTLPEPMAISLSSPCDHSTVSGPGSHCLPLKDLFSLDFSTLLSFSSHFPGCSESSWTHFPSLSLSLLTFYFPKIISTEPRISTSSSSH